MTRFLRNVYGAIAVAAGILCAAIALSQPADVSLELAGGRAIPVSETLPKVSAGISSVKVTRERFTAHFDSVAFTARFSQSPLLSISASRNEPITYVFSNE